MADSPLSAALKRDLKRTITAARRALEEDLTKQLRRLGFDAAKKAPTPLEKLTYLSESERATRATLEAVFAKEQAAAAQNFPEAVAAIRRESAYTHLNRLVGLKCLELRGHLIIEGDATEAVTTRLEFGDRPKWLWTLRERETRYRFGEDADEVLWREGLTQAYTAITAEIRELFDPADPYAQVWPTFKTLRETVDALNALPEAAYRADEVLGWVYQYFQSDAKDEVFEAARVHKRKVEGPDIVPVTQLYTERYMVEFLLQNSLGARWLAMYADSPVAVQWPYYVTPASPFVLPPKPLRDWTLLDPCCGSGHFLLVAFDLFWQLYAAERRLAAEGVIPKEWATPEAETAYTILSRNLYGADIDPRAIQLATLALYLKFKEHSPTPNTPLRIHLVPADAAVFSGPAWERFLAGFEREPSVRRVLEALTVALKDVRELGTLLRPEVELHRIVAEERVIYEAQVRRGAEQPYLLADFAAPRQATLAFEEITDSDFWDRLIYRAQAALQGFVDEARARGELNERVVAGEAQRGFAFLDLCQRRYDVVATNPPYMGSKNMGDTLRDFVAEKYLPGKRDLYAAFILRGLELVHENGNLAVITPQSYLFNSSFALLRETVFHTASVSTVASLGRHAFSEADPPGTSVMVVFQKTDQPHRFSAFRLVASRPADEQAKLLVDAIAGKSKGLSYSAIQSDFDSIPGSPLVYWLTPGILGLLKNDRRLNSIAEVREGLGTRHDERFIRYIWEVKDFGDVVDQKPISGRWFGCAKSGGYQKWAGLELYTVDWESNGKLIREYPKSRVQNDSFFFRPSITYTMMARGKMSARLVKDSIFNDSAPSIFVFNDEQEVLDSLLGLCNTHCVSYLLRVTTQSLQFRPGYVTNLPLPLKELLDFRRVGQMGFILKSWLIQHEVLENRFWRVSNQTDQQFSVREIAGEFEKSQAVLHGLEFCAERMALDGYALQKDDIESIWNETGIPAGFHPLIADYDTLPELPTELPAPPTELTTYLAAHPRLKFSAFDIRRFKNRLRELYVAGPGGSAESTQLVEEESGRSGTEDDESEVAALGARIPIPAETFLEELSQKLEVHPISLYWLLEELRRETGLVCPLEVQQHAGDYLTVKLLRLLGHRWLLQNQYEREQGRPFIVPELIDEDGMIPITEGLSDQSLIERLRHLLDTEQGAERGHTLENELTQALGWRPGEEWGKHKSLSLTRWFEREFFKRHVSQFKKRPIAWHLSSPAGHFQIIVYYHKFNRERLKLLRERYVREALDNLRRRMGEQQQSLPDLSTPVAVKIIGNIEAQMEDLRDFDKRLGQLLDGRAREARIWCPWKSADEQPHGWDPDINDGVRVNIAPVQRLGLLAAPVLAEKDVKSLLAEEGRE